MYKNMYIAPLNLPLRSRVALLVLLCFFPFVLPKAGGCFSPIEGSKQP